ncbi:hypothetical protein ZWY2020_059180 [Hordeum vulgare]|nr:hypothetical protein ZWY2020_059180 [Hordeum vulgare]
MELTATGAAALRRSLASAYTVVPRERRRGMPSRVSCVGRGGIGGGFADEAHLRYYEAVPRKAVEAAARDLTKLRAMGLVAGDPAKEKILSIRASESTPYVIQLSNYDEQPATQPYIQQTENNSTNHPPQELPAFILPIIERHKAKWAQDISKATSRLTKLHAKRMNEFAQDFLAATKDYDPDPTNYSSPHRVLQDTHTEQPQSPGPK